MTKKCKPAKRCKLFQNLADFLMLTAISVAKACKYKYIQLRLFKLNKQLILCMFNVFIYQDTKLRVTF